MYKNTVAKYTITEPTERAEEESYFIFDLCLSSKWFATVNRLRLFLLLWQTKARLTDEKHRKTNNM